MDCKKLEEMLHKEIPITKAMEISVLEFTPSKVRVSAKLTPNVNKKLTAFGGSIYCVMLVCGWSMTYANIRETDVDAHVLLQKSSVQCLKPIEGDIIAECDLTDEKERAKFLKMYERHNKAKLHVDVFCREKGETLAKFDGFFGCVREA